MPARLLGGTKNAAGGAGGGATVTSGYYGEMQTVNTLGNIRVSSDSAHDYDGVANRFVMPKAGTVTGYTFYPVWKAPGYGGGVGHAGIYKIEVRADDGTTNHLPSSTVLATTAALDLQTFAPGVNQKVDISVPFTTPFTVTQGQIVHFAFLQSTISATERASLDCGHDGFDYFASFGPEPNHALLFPNFGVTVKIGASTWSNTDDNIDHYWALGEIAFADGTYYGCNSIDSPSTTAGGSDVLTGAYHEIDATKAVRQVFTPTRTYQAAGLTIRVFKVSGTGGLTVTLKQGAATVFSQTIPAASFTAGGRGSGYAVVDADWIAVPSSAATLASGLPYTLTMTSTGTGLYRMTTVRDGKAAGYAYHVGSGFTDGWAEYTTDGTTWQYTWDTWGTQWPAVGDMDLQFSFTLGAALPFAPTDIAGLLRWYKTDTLAMADGAAVPTWIDSMALGNATQATGAKQPIVKRSIQNGRPVVRFDGVDDVLQFTQTSSTKLSIFFVAKPSTVASAYLIGGSGGAGTPAVISNFGGVGLEAYHSTAASADRATLVASNAAVMQIAGYVLDDAGGAGSFRGYANGVQLFSNVIGDPIGATGFSLIAGATGVPSNPAASDIGEILIYNVAVTAPQAASIMAYLNSRWAVY